MNGTLTTYPILELDAMESSFDLCLKTMNNFPDMAEEIFKTWRIIHWKPPVDNNSEIGQIKGEMAKQPPH